MLTRRLTRLPPAQWCPDCDEDAQRACEEAGYCLMAEFESAILKDKMDREARQKERERRFNPLLSIEQIKVIRRNTRRK